MFPHWRYTITCAPPVTHRWSTGYGTSNNLTHLTHKQTLPPLSLFDNEPDLTSFLHIVTILVSNPVVLMFLFSSVESPKKNIMTDLKKKWTQIKKSDVACRKKKRDTYLSGSTDYRGTRVASEWLTCVLMLFQRDDTPDQNTLFNNIQLQELIRLIYLNYAGVNAAQCTALIFRNVALVT